MATEPSAPLELDESLIGGLDLATASVPHVYLDDEPTVPARLRVGGTIYTYDRSFPILGHSAVMPDAIADLLAEERRILVAEREARYYVYLA